MRGRASARATARLLTVCSVLTGLFLMHGLPEQSCSGGAGMPAVMTAASMIGHGGQPALTAAPEHGDRAVVLPAGPGHGTVCVFTPAPRGIDTLLALLLLAAIVALAWPVRPALGGHRYPRRRRAPPRAGAGLLTALCVSRT